MADNQTSNESSSDQAVSESPAFKVYKPNVPTSRNVFQELPESYFDPTAADLKVAQAALSARTQSLVNSPLELRTAREARQQQKRDRWPTTTIRIRFTDQTMLEKSFPSTDKIRSVYAFVRGSLEEDVKPIKFILYQPPKRDLKVSDPKVRDLSLAELELAPSSLLLLRFAEESLNGSGFPAPLEPSILSKAIDLPPPPSDEVVADRSSGSAPSPPVKPTSQSKEKKVPNWLAAGLRRK